jgi:hypothetical protein
VAIGRTRGSFQRLLDAHLELLRAELAVAGRELGIIVAMAIAALVLAALAITLLYVGTWLFLGEWLFGSIGWGVLHGVLFTVACIVPIGVDLGGGSASAWSRGLLTGVIVTILLSILFASNVLRDAAVSVGQQLEASLLIEPALLPTLVGLVTGGLVLGLVMLVIGLRVGAAFRLMTIGIVLGVIVGAILGSVTFDTKGAVAVSLTLGLIAWIATTIAIAARRGFDPASRYDRLVPRESIAAVESTKEYLLQQWQRQRRRMVGR